MALYIDGVGGVVEPLDFYLDNSDTTDGLQTLKYELEDNIKKIDELIGELREYVCEAHDRIREIETELDDREPEEDEPEATQVAEDDEAEATQAAEDEADQPEEAA